MNDEERRIATAEVCGWTEVALVPCQTQQPGDCPRADTTPVWKGRRPGMNWKNLKGEPVDVGPEVVPYYLNSLDAMHTALQLMNKRQKECFVACLDDGGECPKPDSYIGYIEHPPDSIFDTFINRPARDLNLAFLTVMLP